MNRKNVFVIPSFVLLLTFCFAQVGFASEPPDSTFTDSRDGNVYKMVKIGEQIWMAENLKYLPSVVGPEIGSETKPYYYVYDYNGISVEEAKATENFATYGVLYNWTAAMNGAESSEANPSGVQGICPDGWHLPSDVEWQQLEVYLGMTEKDVNTTDYRGTNEGGKLKEEGTLHWNNPNSDATNEACFSALPGGSRGSYKSFSTIGYGGVWWSSTKGDVYGAWYRNISSNSGNVNRNANYLDSGFSVRCVKD